MSEESMNCEQRRDRFDDRSQIVKWQDSQQDHQSRIGEQNHDTNFERFAYQLEPW
jgi:hypothetical protein